MRINVYNISKKIKGAEFSCPVCTEHRKTGTEGFIANNAHGKVMKI